MQENNSNFSLDVFDYAKRHLCSLYDKDVSISGQAAEVYVNVERNGWKELSFTLPSVCATENGFEHNYRLDYLKADYLIRLIDGCETDWFIISEPKVIHNAFSKNVQVTAGHIAQLLKHKNLGLEFSDDEGNNVGTAQQLAQTILDGTGWSVGYVYPFAEKDGTTKYRSMKASSKTGAFKLIATMCDLFDARPVYHGDNRTVDIVPINPFSEYEPGALPDLSLADQVVEMHYGVNVSGLTRTLNTENIVTKMYAYGAYGDKTSGYCGIDECTHTEYSFILREKCSENQVYFFTVDDGTGISLPYHFTLKTPMLSGSKLVFSQLDPCSEMYIWDDSNQNAYPVARGISGTQLPAECIVNNEVRNWFQFVMNFDYYREVGLLTDEMLQKIAQYQRSAPALYQAISDASARMSDAQTDLSELIGYIDFCKLDIAREEILLGDGYCVLELNKDRYKDGVIYRSDYDKNKENYFKWRVTESLNTDGDPINSAAGIVYIVHDTNPITWDKAYLKAIDDEDDPTYLTLWAAQGSMNIDVSSDHVFLFSYNGINGHIGTLESGDEAAAMSIKETLRVVTVDHPVVFTENDPLTIPLDDLNGYGWLVRYNSDGYLGMYFAYTDEGDDRWNYTYFQDSDPGGGEENSYWFDFRKSVLYRRQSNQWTPLNSTAEKKVAALFSTVYMHARTRERYYHGLHEYYTFSSDRYDLSLPAGNYAFKNEYDSFWTFTTTEEISSGDSLTYDYKDAWITQLKDGVETKLKPKGYRFDNVSYHAKNIIEGHDIESGLIAEDGSLVDNDACCRVQNYVPVVPSTEYEVSAAGLEFAVHYYDEKKNWISWAAVSDSFITPSNCAYIKLCIDASMEDISNGLYGDLSEFVICAYLGDQRIIVDNINYLILPYVTSGEVFGLYSCMDKFVEYADLTYDTYYGELKAAQDAVQSLEKQMIETVGDLYREGWWQDASYVDGDEKKLYEDALDNLDQVSKPEAVYNVTYLDLYHSNNDDVSFGAADESITAKWQEITEMSAIHLVDPEIGVNTWAYVDKLQKCKDKPWQIKVTINTNLSTIAQHSFTDVMSNIANVASEMKGKSSYYDKTLVTAVSSEELERVLAELNKRQKELLSTVTRVDQIEETTITHTSKITRTADEISAEVTRATQEEKELSAKLRLTAEEIAAEVKRATDAENELSASVKINADEISAEVERASQAEGQLSSSIKANEESITSEVKRATDAEGALSTRITQTAEGLSSRVDGIESSSIFSQTEKAVQAIIRDNSNGENAFNTTSVSISKSGVAIATNGTFTVDSGNFDVDENGKVSAHDAFISGELYHNGSPVLTSRDIVVSKTQPTSPFAGMIWIKPITQEDSGSSGSDEEIETIESVEAIYSSTCSSLGWASRSYIGSSYSTSKSGTLYGNGRSTTLTNCTYTVQIPLHLGYTTAQNTNVMCKLTGANGQFVEFAIPVSGTGEKLATGVFQSSVWIGTGDTVLFQICTNATGTYSNVLNSKAGAAEFKVTCVATA